ncbi:hypothetical protein Pres01_02480 [Metapseudomonas resinovorans]|nr:hypothetical protein Pres01_02480 [Pseudomonas resinovorans]
MQGPGADLEDAGCIIQVLGGEVGLVTHGGFSGAGGRFLFFCDDCDWKVNSGDTFVYPTFGRARWPGVTVQTAARLGRGLRRYRKRPVEWPVYHPPGAAGRGRARPL